MPDFNDPFGSPIPPGIWNDEFQGMGGINFTDMLGQRQAQERAYADEMARQQALADDNARIDAEAAYEVGQEQQLADFVDWPRYQQLVGDTPPDAAYDTYIGTLSWQLEQMGYSPEEVAQGIAQFKSTVQRPPSDDGFFGNLWESIKSGAASGTRAVRASGAAATGDDELLAQLAAEATGAQRNAPLTRFQQALSGGTEDEGWSDAIARVASAGFAEPQGLLNFFVEQLAQSYPMLAAGGAGLVGGPVGLAAGVTGGSLALDTGATILEGLAQAADQYSVDPNDPQAMVNLLRDPAVRQQIISDGVKHGVPVAVMDGATSVLSLGIGGAVARAARAGATGRATALTGAGLLGESAGGAAGDVLGQLSQHGRIVSKQDPLLEAIGELGPGGATIAAGAIRDGLRAPRATPVPPGAPPTVPDIEEGDLPSSGELPPTPPPIRVTSTGEAFVATPDNVAAYDQYTAQRAIQEAEQKLRTEEARLAALAKAVADNRPGVVEAEFEPVVNFDDAESIREALARQGIGFRAVLANDLVDMIANAPTDSKREAIADAINGLQDEDLASAEPMADALLRLSSQLPPIDADAVAQRLTVQPSESLLNTVKRVTGQRTSADRKATIQAWVDHFLAMPRDLGAEQARREVIADEAWQRAEEAARVELMNEIPNNGPVNQAYLDSSQQRLDNAIERLGRRTPTSRPKLQKLRERAGMLLEETVYAYNQRFGELPAASSSGAGVGRGGSAGVGGGAAGGLTRGGRSSTASAITPLQYRYLNEQGGRKDISNSIGARRIADELGIAPEEVTITIAEALAQEIALSVPLEDLNGPKYRASPRPLYSNRPLEEAIASEARARRGLKRADVQRRALRPGELIPTADIVAGQRGPVEAGRNPQEAEGQPRGGLRSRVAPQGAVARGLVDDGQSAVGGADQGGVGIQPDDTQGNRGLPRVVRGRGYDEVTQEERRGLRRVGRPQATQRQVSADVNLIEQGLIAEEKRQRAAENEAQRAEREKQKTKSQKLSLKRAEREQRKALAVLEREANAETGVTPEERVDALKNAYERLYPNNTFDDDVNDVFSDVGVVTGPLLSPSAVRTLQMSPFNSVMDYMSSVMQSPLQRLIARQIQTLGLDVPIQVGPLPGTERGRYRAGLLPGGSRAESITIDPSKASLNTVLHEAVHAATVAAMRFPKTAAQRLAANNMNELYKYVVANMPGSTQYGLTNVEEFVAEALTNPKFQKELQKLALPGESKYGISNALDAFKRLVLRLLGLDKSTNVLSEALLTASDLFSNRKMDQNVELAERQQGAAIPSTAIGGIKDGARTHIAYAKGDAFTLYPVTAAEPRGIKGAGVPKLTRDQVEEQIRAAGSEVLPPVADSRPAPGTPKESSTKLIGFTPDGDLHAAAFEQKNGTWTYYESDSDVRTDPYAKVQKGLTKDQAQRYITAKGLQNVAPTSGAVKPNGLKPTAIGYKPPKDWVVTWQDSEAALKKLGEAQKQRGDPPHMWVHFAAIFRNTRVSEKIKEVTKQYFEPARKAGEQISKEFNKTQADIEELMRQLHLEERAQTKIRQAQQGNMDPQTLAAFTTRQNKIIADSQAYVRNVQNPGYVDAVKTRLAPKMKALADNTIDLNAQYGFISRETAEQIKRAYDFYVPMQTGERTTSNKAATGRATTGDLSFSRLQEQAVRTIARGEQNVVRQMAMDLMADGGVVDAKGEPIATVGSGTRISYDKDTNSLNETVDNRVFDPDTIVVYRNGERIPVTVRDNAMLEALHPYKGEERKTAITWLLMAAGYINHMISIGKTALSPAFAPFNFMRDAGTALINMPPGVSRVKYMAQFMNPETFISPFLNVFRDAVTGEMGQNRFGNLARSGGLISQRAYIGLDVIANSLDSQFRPSTWSKLKGKKEGTFKLLTSWSQSLESITRYAVYKAAKDSGLSEIESVAAAKTASVNFETRGLKNPSPMYIFANAKIQGLAAIVNSMTRNGGDPKVIAGVLGIVALGFLAGGIGYSRSEKDKDGKSKYAKIPDYKKDTLILLEEGAKGVPIPQEVAPFYVLGNALADKYYGGKTSGEAASRIMTSTINALWPGNVPQSELVGHKSRPMEFMLRAVTPSQILPVVDVATNRTTFGSPIVSDLEGKKARGLPGYEMGSANESELAVNAAKGLHKATGGHIDAAPQQLRLLNNMFNPGAEGYAFFRDLAGMREPKYQGDIVNPIARKFTGAATPFYDQDQFDALMTKATQAKFMAKEQGGADNLPPEERALAKSADMLAQVKRDASALFKNSKLLSKEQIRLRQDRQKELLLDGIRRYNELRDRMPRN